MRCATCAKAAMLEIRMKVGGEDVTFRRCGHCEAQHWSMGEDHLSLARVLELVRTH